VQVYLSSSSSDGFFIDAAVEAVRLANERFGPEAILFVFPPRQIGGDLGRIDLNVRRLLESDVTIFNISPEQVGNAAIYNPGVMIEYGMVFASDRTNPLWEGRLPVPIHRVYCDSSFDKTNLTPILNLESVQSFDRSESGRGALVARLLELLTSRLRQRMSYTYTPFSDQAPSM